MNGKLNIPTLWVRLVKVTNARKSAGDFSVFMNNSVNSESLMEHHASLKASYCPMILKKLTTILNLSLSDFQF